jgi:hypothetical protein
LKKDIVSHLKSLLTQIRKIGTKKLEKIEKNGIFGGKLPKLGLILFWWELSFDDLNGSVGSIANLILKGPGIESQISHGFSELKEVEDIGLTNRSRKRSKYV